MPNPKLRRDRMPRHHFREQKDRHNPRDSSACIHDCMYISWRFSPTLSCFNYLIGTFLAQGHLAAQHGYEHIPAVHMVRDPCTYRKFQYACDQVVFATSHG
jgi:hypothetical protein